MYWQSITIIEAQDLLMQMKIADYPHMKTPDRKKFFKDIEKLSSPKELRTQSKISTLSDFANMLAGR